jgi:hypothetical protein
MAGTIPDSVYNLRKLKGLYLSNNNLISPLPKSLARLTDLQYLDLSNQILDASSGVPIGQNNFNEPLPTFLFHEASKVEDLWLHGVGFTGLCAIILLFYLLSKYLFYNFDLSKSVR